MPSHEAPRPSSEHLPKEGHSTVQARSLLAPTTSGVQLLVSKHHSPVVRRRQMNAYPLHPVPGTHQTVMLCLHILSNGPP